jgi:cell division protein FtsB
MSRVIQPRIVLVVTGIVVVFTLFSLGQEISRRWQIDHQVAQLEQQADGMKKNVVELQNLNQYFQTPDYQERLAREKLNYRAPGEQVVLLPEDSSAPQPAAVTIAVPKQPLPLPLVWWNMFFVDAPR